MIIEKKILTEYFELILKGEKSYDWRLADFEINSGDTLVLKEWDSKTNYYTGREIKKTVGYIGKVTKEYLDTFSKEDIEKYGFQIISFK
jgi:hypothetical protein